MAKLAVVVALDATRPVADWPVIAVPAGDEALLETGLGDRLVVYAATPDRRGGYVALARLDGWRAAGGSGQLALDLGDIQRFPLLVPTTSGGDVPLPGPGRRVAASEAIMVPGDVAPIAERELATIVRNGGLADEAARLDAAFGFAETQAAFGGGEEDWRSAAFGELLADLLEAYDGRCAFTGSPLIGPHTASRPLLVFFRPIEDEGPMAPANAAPACEPAWSAMTRGDMTIGIRYEFIVALDRMVPTLRDPDAEPHLNPAGRLALPSREDAMPDARHLAFHREKVFNRE